MDESWTVAMTVPRLVKRSAEAHPSKPALAVERAENWQVWTYADLIASSQAFAHGLCDDDYGVGDRVILYAESQPEWVIAYLGCVAAGLTVIPLDPQTQVDEVQAVAEFTSAKLVIVSDAIIKDLTRRYGDQPCPISARVRSLSDMPTGPYEALPSPVDRAEPDTPASIIFTAGTTVDPKGVILTHRNFVENVAGISELLPPDETDRFLSVLPLNHAFEFTSGLLVPLSVGATVYYASSLNPRKISAAIAETQATVMIGMPRLFRMIYDSVRRRADADSRSPQDLLRSFFGSDMRVLVSGGAALDPDVYADFDGAGLPIHEGYGLTETAPVLTVNPYGGTRRGSVGIPLPGVDLHIDAPGQDGIGEIVARGASLMAGYFRNDVATEQVLRDGWLYTGDLGYCDDDGYLYITGRSKDVIVTSAGKNVYPSEVEWIYKDLPHVREICVLGLGDAQKREEVHAVLVVPKDVASTPDLRREAQQAIQETSVGIPSYQRIQHVHYWTRELPKTHSLKVKRDEVRALLLTSGGSEDPLPQVPHAEIWTEKEWEVDLIGKIAQLASVEVRAILPRHDFDRDLHLDSLMKVELLSMLESHLGLSLPEHIALKLRTVQDVIDYIAPYMDAGWDGRAEFDSCQTMARDALPTLDVDSRYLTKTALQRGLGDGFRVAASIVYRGAFKMRGIGMEHLPARESFIIAANHASHLDGAAIMTMLGKKARDLHILGAKDYFFDGPLKAWLVSTFLNVLPFDRHDNFLRSLGLSQRAVQMGRSLLIFPEGTRSRTGEITTFKPGLGLLALELGVPIVPAYIDGTYDALPAGRVIPKPSPVRVVFGDPLRMEEYLERRDSESHYPLYREITNRVQQAVESLREATRGAG